MCELEQILRSNDTSSAALEKADPERLQLLRKHTNGLKSLLASGLTFKKIKGLELAKLSVLICNPIILAPLKQFGFHLDEILAMSKEHLTICHQFNHQLCHLKASGFTTDHLRQMAIETLKLVCTEVRRTQRMINAGLNIHQIITMNPNSLNVFIKNAYDLAHLSLTQEQLAELATMDADHLAPLLSHTAVLKLFLNRQVSFQQLRSANKTVLTNCVQHIDQFAKALTLISMEQIWGVAKVPSQPMPASPSPTVYTLEEVREIPGINSRKADALCQHRAVAEELLKWRVDVLDLAKVDEERLIKVLSDVEAVKAALHFVSAFELLGVPEKTQYSPRQFKPEPVSRTPVASNQATVQDKSSCVIQ